MKPSPLLSFEAKAATARQVSGDLAGSGNQSAHNELSARAEGDWRLGGFKVAPSVSVARAAEAGGADSAKPPKGTIIVAPSISRPVPLGDAKTLEPFFGLKQEIDMAAGPAQPGSGPRPDVTRSAGGGVKLEARDAYSLSLTTDVENLEAEKHAVRSQLRLNLQLK